MVATPQLLPGVETKNDSLHYGIYDLGAHAFAYRPPGHKPVLWMSQSSLYETGTAIRGGVPIILPWFGPGISGQRKPNHGFARTTVWTRTAVEDTLDSDGKLCVHYDMTSDKSSECPVSWIAGYRAEFTPIHLEVALTVINTGNVQFTFEDALHTYLAVGDIKSVTVDGLDQSAYFDKVPNATIRNRLQEGSVTFTQETDRIYQSRARVAVTDPVWERRIIVEKKSSANTVVWNPWTEKAAAMADFGDNEWRGMLCIEAANVLDNAITLPPRSSHVMTQKISVEKL